MKGLEPLRYGGILRELWLLSLEKRRLRGFLSLCANTWWLWSRRQSHSFLSGAHWKDKRQWPQTEIQKITFKHKKKKITVKMIEDLSLVIQWHCEISSFADVQNLTGCGPEQPAPAHPALRREVGLDELQQCCLVSNILQCFDSLTYVMTLFLITVIIRINICAFLLSDLQRSRAFSSIFPYSVVVLGKTL